MFCSAPNKLHILSRPHTLMTVLTDARNIKEWRVWMAQDRSMLYSMHRYNYRKRLSDTWWLLSMRLRTRLGHGQYLCLCKAHRRAKEIRSHQIVRCWSWIIQACVSVTFQWKFLREPCKNIHENIEILQLYVLSHDRSWGRGWAPVKPV